MSSDPVTPPKEGVAPEEVLVRPPEAPVTGGLLSKAGVDLSLWLLLIISVFVVGMVVWLVLSESHYSQWLYSQRSSLQADDVSAVIREQGTFREFWLKIFQMVLLNTLLPVLTAILGYTFGSRPS